jgi:DNA-directed RNA polymerase specialized sigma24 family protein
MHRAVLDALGKGGPPWHRLRLARSSSAPLAPALTLVEALRRLPSRQREVVVLRYLGDLSQAETAAALKVSEGAVKQHASRGLAALRLVLPEARLGS